MALIQLIGVSHIPLPFYVPVSLNYVYFNLNFSVEKWQRTVSFFKLESNQMINAVSAKQARRLFCIFFGSEIGNWMENSSCFLNEEFSFLSCIGLANDTTNLLFHHAL